MNRLEKCPSCARHVRLTESSCPFCQAALPESFKATPARALPKRRLGRNALYTFSAGVVAVAGLTACSSDDNSGGGSDGGDDAMMVNQDAYGGPPVGADGGDDGQVVALYGGPPVQVDAGDDDADAMVTGDAYGGPPLVDAAYGGPPLEDAGADADAGD